jgi:hypothetical protein
MIAAAVAAGWFPSLALVGVLPTWFAVPAMRWALSRPAEPVPTPAMAGNVIWNLATNSLVAAGLALAAYLGW